MDALPDLILSSSTTRLLKERALLPLCVLSDPKAWKSFLWHNKNAIKKSESRSKSAPKRLLYKACHIPQISRNTQPLLHQQSSLPHHTTIVLRPFFRDHPGEPVPEENFWTLWCKRRLAEADTPTIRLGATPSGLSSTNLQHLPIFYRPDALPAAQPTVSNQRNNKVEASKKSVKKCSADNTGGLG